MSGNYEAKHRPTWESWQNCVCAPPYVMLVCESQCARWLGRRSLSARRWAVRGERLTMRGRIATLVVLMWCVTLVGCGSSARRSTDPDFILRVNSMSPNRTQASRVPVRYRRSRLQPHLVGCYAATVRGLGL